MAFFSRSVETSADAQGAYSGAWFAGTDTFHQVYWDYVVGTSTVFGAIFELDENEVSNISNAVFTAEYQSQGSTDTIPVLYKVVEDIDSWSDGGNEPGPVFSGSGNSTVSGNATNGADLVSPDLSTVLQAAADNATFTAGKANVAIIVATDGTGTQQQRQWHSLESGTKTFAPTLTYNYVAPQSSLSVTHVASGSGSSDPQSTASLTVNRGDVLIVSVAASNNPSSAVIENSMYIGDTFDVSSADWEEWHGEAYPPFGAGQPYRSRRRLWVFIGVGGEGTGVINLDNTMLNFEEVVWSIERATGVSQTLPGAAVAFNGDTTGASVGPQTVTGTAGDANFSALALEVTGITGQSSEAGWTDLGEETDLTGIRNLYTAWHPTGDATATWDWDNNSGWGMLNVALNEVPTQEMVWSSNGDTNGLFYYLGTNGGTESWLNPLRYRNVDTRSFNTPGSQYPWYVANRETPASGTRYISDNAVVGQWLQFGFPGRMAVTDYTLTSSFDGQNIPRSWVVEGSNDLSGSWTTIDTRTDDTSLTGSGATFHFTGLSGDTVTEFQWIRFRQTGVNSSSNNYLVIDEMEFYGRWWKTADLITTHTGHTVYDVMDNGGATGTTGIMYNVGTFEGTQSWENPAGTTRLTATASSNSANAVRATDTNITVSGRYLSADTANSWIKWDFGLGSEVTVQGWAYYPSQDFNHVFEIGELQGSNNNSNWETLGTYDFSSISYRDGTDLNYFSVDDVTNNKTYRWIRLIQTGLNNTNTDYLSVNYFDLYGTYKAPLSTGGGGSGTIPILGSTSATNVYVGSTAASAIYLGSSLLWSSGGGAPTQVAVDSIFNDTLAGTDANWILANDGGGSLTTGVHFYSTKAIRIHGIRIYVPTSEAANSTFLNTDFTVAIVGRDWTSTNNFADAGSISPLVTNDLEKTFTEPLHVGWNDLFFDSSYDIPNNIASGTQGSADCILVAVQWAGGQYYIYNNTDVAQSAVDSATSTGTYLAEGPFYRRQNSIGGWAAGAGADYGQIDILFEDIS